MCQWKQIFYTKFRCIAVTFSGCEIFKGFGSKFGISFSFGLGLYNWEEVQFDLSFQFLALTAQALKKFVQICEGDHFLSVCKFITTVFVKQPLPHFPTQEVRSLSDPFSPPQAHFSGQQCTSALMQINLEIFYFVQYIGPKCAQRSCITHNVCFCWYVSMYVFNLGTHIPVVCFRTRCHIFFWDFEWILLHLEKFKRPQ